MLLAQRIAERLFIAEQLRGAIAQRIAERLFIAEQLRGAIAQRNCGASITDSVAPIGLLACGLERLTGKESW